MTAPSLSRSIRALVLIGAVSIFAPQFTQAADEKPTTRPQRPMPNRDPAAGLKMQRERLNELNLTDDQKKKLDEIYASAATDIGKAMEETKNADPQERRQKMMPLMMAIREKVGGVLTDEQKQKLQQIGPMAGGPGGSGRGNMFARLKENLAKLDLSSDQKTKADAVLEASQKKTDALRAEAENGNADRQKLMEKGQQIGDETRDKLKEILTSDQQEKLRTLMQADGGQPGGPRPGGFRGRPGAATQPSK